MKLSYYPGCSLHGTSKEYDISTRAVCQHLGVELEELSGWNCCGASSAHSLNHLLAQALPARNLKLAQEKGLDLVLPCAACFNRVKTADNLLHDESDLSREVSDLVDFRYKGEIGIIHLLDLICNKLGLDVIKSKVTKPLSGLKLACYYGCLVVRPIEIVKFDHPEHPQTLDRLMKAIGAETLNWSYKTECCGASLSLTRDDIVKNLVSKIIRMAREAGAHAIVALCPLCHQNLEMRQENADFPIFYLTELLGLAFGISESRDWLEKHLVDSSELLHSLELLS